MVQTNVARIALTGPLPGGEVFSTSFWIYPVSAGDTIPDNAADAQTVIDRLTGLSSWAGFKSAVEEWLPAGGFGLSAATIYCYPTGGTHATATAVKALTPGGAHPVPTHPNQCAAVVSLRSSQAGRNARGRMYLPVLAATLTTAGQLNATEVGTVATAFATYFGDLALSVILPSGNGVFPTFGRATGLPVIKLENVVVDSVVDTQRRRRNKLVAATRSVADIDYT